MSDIGLTILVNSTDGFEDCWEPFFKLFAIYWPDCAYPIVLNTETKTYTHPGLNLRCSRVGASAPEAKPSWSDCLIRCLDQIDSKYILYLQEDYFLNARVDVETIRSFVEIMAREGYAHIRLMALEAAEEQDHRPSPKYPLLWEISQRAHYRIGLQAGLWAKDRLRFYLKPGETGWQFERWGTLRAHKVKDTFFCQNIDHFNRQGRYIFPYTPTGIVRGQWFEPAVVDLFARHGIEVDYSARGFYRPNQWQKYRQRLRSKARRLFMQCAS
jgi:hypothetical protein